MQIDALKGSFRDPQRSMSITWKASLLHGNGVFATEDIREGAVIEVCPIVVLGAKDTAIIDGTHLYNYYFRWGDNGAALALGYGSLYNHAYEPNATYEKDVARNVIVFKALKPIPSSQEITVNYNNGDPLNKNAVWFEQK